MPRTPKQPGETKYTVINISPRMTKEEQQQYMEKIMPTFMKVMGYREVSEDYEPKPVTEVSPDELGDSDSAKKARAFLKEHPDYMAWR